MFKVISIIVMPPCDLACSNFRCLKIARRTGWKQRDM